MHTATLDEFDVRLLHALQPNSRLTHNELAEQVFLSPSQCQRRVKRLEELGIIEHYATHINRAKTGFHVTAIIHVSIEKHGKFPAEEFKELIDRSDAVLECYSTMGDFDYFLKVVVPDLNALNEFMMQRLLNSPIVTHIRSNILLQEIKATHALPIHKL
jgi:Lrp/AsnC family leucine-responsive transcriptional regulator